MTFLQGTVILGNGIFSSDIREKLTPLGIRETYLSHPPSLSNPSVNYCRDVRGGSVIGSPMMLPLGGRLARIRHFYLQEQEFTPFAIRGTQLRDPHKPLSKITTLMFEGFERVP